MTTLNSEQQAVVNAREGAYALISGPGTGKTTTLIARVNALVSSGVYGSEILGITFTKEASAEMQRRSSKARFCTFHSFGYSVIAAEKGKPPMEPELRHRLLYRLTRKYRIEYKDLAAFISKMRHENISPEQALEEDGSWKYGFPRAYAEYERERKAGGWIDFDSMLVDALTLLENPEVRARHQWKYVMADEFQDTDFTQMKILQLITEKHGNVMSIGDPGQSLYQFRGAKPEVLTQFHTYFPGAEYLYLGRNYRSTQTITDYVRRHYPLEIPLKEKIVAAREVQGEPIEYRMFNSELEEAESAIVAANTDPLNSAILARTNRMLGPVENFLIEHNIRYTLLGKSGFWRQSEITRAVEKLKPYSHLSLAAAMGLVLPDVERHYQADDATREDNDALENLKTLKEIGKKFKSCLEFVTYANRAAHRKKAKGITISTIHQSKGTEFRNIFVIGARDGMMPHPKGDWAEERRIWMVAISRAIDKLRISWAGNPSYFIRPELTPEIMQKLEEDSGRVERVQKQLALL
jgi:DNA helicase-2/ATP-dependent DNA helicase PcrA